ncbi:MAG: hypothetical protein LUC93_01935 [Planctomycetaceae bacterium]|nr:hypothetical protein [Planctomycetaceae bacterium]
MADCFLAFFRKSTNKASGTGGADKKESKQKAKQGGTVTGVPNRNTLILPVHGHSFGFQPRPINGLVVDGITSI